MTILIVINNYFHDVATAFLTAAVILMFLIDRQLNPGNDKKLIKIYIDLYNKFTLVARIALAWIIIGGIPRTIFYKKIEWSMALGNGIVAALIVKHILMFTFVGLGIIFWRQLAKKVSLLKEIGEYKTLN